MSGSFNQLTFAQAERLALLLEELGEAQQAIGKILRHGYESKWPPFIGQSNRQALEQEVGDIHHAVSRLIVAGDLRGAEIHSASDKKADRISVYLHHQEQTESNV